MNEASINLAVDNTPFGDQKSIYQIQTESILTLLKKAGLSTKDVDGIATNGVERFSSVGMAEYLGINPKWSESSFLGGSSYLTFVKRAIINNCMMKQVRLLVDGEIIKNLQDF